MRAQQSYEKSMSWIYHVLKGCQLWHRPWNQATTKSNIVFLHNANSLGKKEMWYPSQLIGISANWCPKNIGWRSAFFCRFSHEKEAVIILQPKWRPVWKSLEYLGFMDLWWQIYNCRKNSGLRGFEQNWFQFFLLSGYLSV